MRASNCRSWSEKLFSRAQSSPRLIGQRLAPRYSTSSPKESEDISAMLSKPSWSVQSLLPSSLEASEAPSVTSKQLHHLLQLSALPLPKDQAEEDEMLLTLRSQLHFVKEIQKVDTEGVEPLQSIRDETEAARKESEVTYEDLKHILDKEERIAGGWLIRRKEKDAVNANGAEDWDVLGQASRKVGRFLLSRRDLIAILRETLSAFRAIIQGERPFK